MGRISFRRHGTPHATSGKNWGPWSCCGGTASSPGCRQRAPLPSPTTQEGTDTKYIKFLTMGNICEVVAEETLCWRLDNGRVAKKTTGKVWVWCDGSGQPV